jgi:hypothetical protein
MQRWVIFNTVMEIQNSRRWYSPHKQMLRLKSCKTLNEIHQGSNFNGLSGHQVQWVTAKHHCIVWKNKVQDCSETISPSLSHPASHGFSKDLTCAVEESIRGLTLQAFPIWVQPDEKQWNEENGFPWSSLARNHVISIQYSRTTSANILQTFSMCREKYKDGRSFMLSVLCICPSEELLILIQFKNPKLSTSKNVSAAFDPANQ